MTYRERERERRGEREMFWSVYKHAWMSNWLRKRERERERKSKCVKNNWGVEIADTSRVKISLLYVHISRYFSLYSFSFALCLSLSLSLSLHVLLCSLFFSSPSSFPLSILCVMTGRPIMSSVKIFSIDVPIHLPSPANRDLLTHKHTDTQTHTHTHT